MKWHYAFCPRCGQYSHCGNTCCRKKNTDLGLTVNTWIDGWTIECGWCGYTMSADQWEDQEGYSYRHKYSAYLLWAWLNLKWKLGFIDKKDDTTRV